MNIPSPSSNHTQTFIRWWVLLLIVFLVHNLEEVIFDMPAWEMTHRLPFWMEMTRTMHSSMQLTPSRFMIVIGILCMAIMTITVLLRKKARASRIWTIGFTTLMIGIYIGHLASSIYARSAMPGVYTAVALGIPIYSAVLYQVIKVSIATKTL